MMHGDPTALSEVLHAHPQPKIYEDALSNLDHLYEGVCNCIMHHVYVRD